MSTIAIIISCALIFGADWIISTEVKDFKARRQSKLDQEKIAEKTKKTKTYVLEPESS